jgi:hypothetical protein
MKITIVLLVCSWYVVSTEFYCRGEMNEGASTCLHGCWRLYVRGPYGMLKSTYILDNVRGINACEPYYLLY